MSAGNAHHEKRKADRCPVTGRRRQATLTVGNQEYPVLVINESAGGFAVRMCQKPGGQPGDVAVLRTVSGESEVRVTYLREDRLSIVESATQQMGAEWLYLVGLERLQDYACPPDISGLRLWAAVPRILLRAVPRLSTIVVGIAVASLAVVIPLAAFALASKLDRKTLRQAGVLDDRSIPLASETGASRAARSRSSRGSVPTAEGPRPVGQLAAPTLRSPVPKVRISPLVRRMRQAGPAGVLLPEVVTRLSLTEKQQAEIREILQASGLFREVSGAWHWATGAPPDADSRALVDQVERQVGAILTEAQRALWEALRGAAAAPAADRTGGPAS